MYLIEGFFKKKLVFSRARQGPPIGPRGRPEIALPTPGTTGRVGDVAGPLGRLLGRPGPAAGPVARGSRVEDLEAGRAPPRAQIPESGGRRDHKIFKTTVLRAP